MHFTIVNDPITLSQAPLLTSATDRGVSIPPERMASLNRGDEIDSWKLYGSGPGYLAQLGVFHQLHCLVIHYSMALSVS